MLMLAQKRAEAHSKNSCLKLHAFDLKFGGNIQLIKIYNYCDASTALQSRFILMWGYRQKARRKRATLF